jgi:serine/threonine protein kinase
LLGEGGAGRVYGGIGPDESPIAVKVLAEERASAEKRRRFRNELAFQARNRHGNIVTVIDHGVTRGADVSGPFYVMRRYEANLRELIKAGIDPEQVMSLFSQILDGVEAAHLQGVHHRDLKPENILHSREANTVAVADFGTAHFTDDLIVTQVETQPTQRLANFVYAAPEQRVAGKYDGAKADIYALGSILNEMYTGTVPHGTDFRTISQSAEHWGYLDGVVERMLRQNPGDRPTSVGEVKALIRRFQADAVSLQRLGEIDGTVVKAGEVDNPLAITPPMLVGADWNRGQLTLTLDRPVTQEWVNAFHQMRGYTALVGAEPARFQFRGNEALVQVQDYQAQMAVDHFKNWLPTATLTLRNQLEDAARRREAAEKDQLRREREAEEQRLRVMRQLRI